VARAEAAIAVLSPQFESWMENEVGTVAKTWQKWKALDFGDGEERETFYRSAHDLKGQAATLGFPLAAQVAASLCALLEAPNAQNPIPTELIGQHVNAIRAIYRERAKDESDRVGMALVVALEEMAAQHIGTPADGDVDDGLI
jgi:hypothetical protein